MDLYYKAVDATGSVRRSLIVGDSRMGMDYIPGEWVNAKIGGILVFSEIAAAQLFVLGLEGYEIWECEVSDPVALPPYRLTNITVIEDLSIVKDFWNTNIPNGYQYIDDPWPTFTSAFRKIKLTTLVDQDLSIRAA